jgi:hypothetical protein
MPRVKHWPGFEPETARVLEFESWKKIVAPTGLPGEGIADGMSRGELVFVGDDWAGTSAHPPARYRKRVCRIADPLALIRGSATRSRRSSRPR